MVNARQRSQAEEMEAHRVRARALAASAFAPIAASECDNESPNVPLADALMAIVSGWREEAISLEGVRTRGATGRQKDLRTAAGLLAVVAQDVIKLDFEASLAIASDAVQGIHQTIEAMNSTPTSSDAVDIVQIAADVSLVMPEVSPEAIVADVRAANPSARPTDDRPLYDAIAAARVGAQAQPLETYAPADFDVFDAIGGPAITNRELTELERATFGTPQEQLALPFDMDQAKADAMAFIGAGIPGYSPEGQTATTREQRRSDEISVPRGGIQFPVSPAVAGAWAETAGQLLIPIPEGTPVPDFVFLDPAPRPTEPERLTFHQVDSLWDQIPPSGNTSYSKITESEDCGMRYLLNRAARRNLVPRGVPSWALIGGKAFHAAIETIERGAPLPDEPAELWVNALDGQIADAQLESGLDPIDFRASNRGLENGDWWRVEGERMVQLYLDKHTPAVREQAQILMLLDAQAQPLIPAVEIPFSMEVGGTRLDGQIDQIWQHGAGYVVRDLKAGKTDGDPFQLSIYEQHLIRNWGLSPSAVRSSFWNARKGIQTTDTSNAATHPFDELQYRVDAQVRKEAAHIAEPRVSSFCHGCEFKKLCPAGPRS